MYSFLIKILHNTILITPWKPLLCCFCQCGYFSISLVWSILVSSLNENSRLGRRQHLVDVLKCHLRMFSLLTLGATKSLQNSHFLTVKLSLIHMFLKETCKTCFIFFFLHSLRIQKALIPRRNGSVHLP